MSPQFKTHFLNSQGKERAQIIAEKFDALLSDISDICPSSRCFSIPSTKLEEACFFAKKAMAERPENQEAQ